MALHGGIDLGGTKIQAAVVDDTGAVRGQSRRPTPTDGGPEGVAAEMVVALDEAAVAAGTEATALDGVGVGSPGAVENELGTVSEVVNIPGWEGAFQLRDALADRLGTRVALGNDVQVATDAEVALGAGRPFSSLLGVFWGTGVGGGVVLDGRAWLGRSSAGEVGHMVVKQGGRRCGCGRKGCMEAYAGRGSMEREARRRHDDEGEPTDLFKIMEKRGRERLSSGIWSRALDQGDKLAESLLAEAVAALGAGVASAINLLDVEAVVIGGGMGLRLGEPYVERIRAAMLPHLFKDSDPPAVVLAELGDLGGAIGASLLVSAPQPA
jgi:glucokinase